ncbi:hypothetical protein EAE93_23870 [Photorhabdus akhurstii]|nr:hypothetical protein [Photorhabdus akhurstii]
MDSSAVSRFPVSTWGSVKGRPRASLRTDCPLPSACPAVNAGRPALNPGVLCNSRCRSAAIQHNVALSAMGLNGPPRLTEHYVGAAHRRALRGYLTPGARLAAGLGFLAPVARKADAFRCQLLH